MSTVLLILHLFVTLALIGVVLIQRSEGGGLGIGNSQGMGSFMSGRGTANLLTRTTAILATAFMTLALVLALLNRGAVGGGHSMLDIPTAAAPAPAVTPVAGDTTQQPADDKPSSKIPTVPGGEVSGTAASTSHAKPVPDAPQTTPGSAGYTAPNKPVAPSEPGKAPGVPTN